MRDHPLQDSSARAVESSASRMTNAMSIVVLSRNGPSERSARTRKTPHLAVP
jgi:hypothetical protein